MGLRHRKLDVSAFAVYGSDQAVHQHKNEQQSKRCVNQGPNDVVPALGHHRLLHRRRERFRRSHDGFHKAIVLFDGLHKFDHVNGAVVVSIQVLNDGNDVQFGEGHASERCNGLAQFVVCDALRTVGVNLVEHLSHVEVIQCIQQCSEGVVMVNGFFCFDINVFLEVIIFFLDVVRLLKFVLHIIVFRFDVFFHGIIKLIIVSVFFEIVVNLNVLLLLIYCGFFLFDLVFCLLSFGVFRVLHRLHYHTWFWLTHKGFSGLGEFFLIQIPVFVFIKRPRVLHKCIGIVNAVLVHDTLKDGF